jgi:hypothetical protein
MHHPDALPQGDARRWPARYGCPIGRLCYLEVVYPCDVLGDAVAYFVPAGRSVRNIWRPPGVFRAEPRMWVPETPPDLPLDCDSRAGFSLANEPA